MVVIVVTACPVNLRGDLSRWLLEIAPGVFVGHVSARVRDALWDRVVAFAHDGRAIMVHSARNEQHLAFRVHRSSWIPEDCDGLTLMMRPDGSERETLFGARKHGWSNAAKSRRAHRFG